MNSDHVERRLIGIIALAIILALTLASCARHKLPCDATGAPLYGPHNSQSAPIYYDWIKP